MLPAAASSARCLSGTRRLFQRECWLNQIKFNRKHHNLQCYDASARGMYNAEKCEVFDAERGASSSRTSKCSQWKGAGEAGRCSAAWQDAGRCCTVRGDKAVLDEGGSTKAAVEMTAEQEGEATKKFRV